MPLFGLLSILMAAQLVFAESYSVTTLPTLGGTISLAYGMNNLGAVVGYSTLPGDAVYHACLWQSGTITDLTAPIARLTRSMTPAKSWGIY